MRRRFAQLVGRRRLSHGRCPACNFAERERCDVCEGGSQVPDPMTLRRWARRFETRLWVETPSRETTWVRAETAHPA